MSAVLQEAKKKTASAKGWVSRSVKELEDLLNDDATSLGLLEATICTFDKRLADLENHQTAVELELDSDEVESDMDETDKFQRSARKTRAKASKRLRDMTIISDSISVSSKDRSEVKCCVCTAKPVDESELHEFWSLECIGTCAGRDKSTKDPVLDNFEKSVKFVDGGYEVVLPWKSDVSKLSLLDNETGARRRLATLYSKFERSPSLRVEYDKVLKSYEDSNIIEEIPQSEMEGPYPIYYMPHRPVIKECVFSKIRPVFDASAVGPNGVSLNDCLESGPSLIPDLVEILLRFRRWKIGLTADITKAFLQIRVQRLDQDVHRFLWQRGQSIRVMSDSFFEVGETTKLLGMHWNASKDVFSFKGLDLDCNFDLNITKRNILSLIVRLCYYPDSSLSSVVRLEIHAFNDASQKGYGSCVYLRIPKSDKEFHVSFVMDRTKLVPIKRVTLPRLELLGALLSVRLGHFVKSALCLNGCVRLVCWTDPKVALSWIKGNPNRWKMFVANRVTEIQTSTSPSNWFHCPGTDNPADLMARGLLADQLISNNMWLGGPNWLSSSSCFRAGANVEDKTQILAHTCEEIQFQQNLLKHAGVHTLMSTIRNSYWIIGLRQMAKSWKFIAPRFPWWGGWWERHVRSVKSALKKCLGTRCLTKCELETTLFEVEACINSRPLIYVSDDHDVKNPMTPSHVLIGRVSGFQPHVSDEHLDVNHKDLNEREHVRERKLDRFWKMWSDDYVRNLPPTVKGSKPNCNMKKGSVVLLGEDNVPRMSWHFGVIIELLPGRDGIVRCVNVKTAKGVLCRPVQKLHDLESCFETNSVNENIENPLECFMPDEEDVARDESAESLEQVKSSRNGRVVKPPCVLLDFGEYVQDTTIALKSPC
ncbi:uncharacterized protein LOC143018676 [Oratosquilla oratoria]|uniref:uncharacterized protein LOC143018676 n=1 Tax=Oratosquilla oratoria TaxID=337810 RepID=UPI003F77710E